MLIQPNYNREPDWEVRRFVDVDEEFRELLGEEVLGLVGGRVRKMGGKEIYTAWNADDAVKAYILNRLNTRDGVETLDVEVMVVPQHKKALAEFQVLKSDGSHEGFYQASIMIGEGIG
jgi:hypothetical protein